MIIACMPNTDVLVGMFVDVGSNRSVLDQMKLSFVFEEIGQSDPFQKYLRDVSHRFLYPFSLILLF